MHWSWQSTTWDISIGDHVGTGAGAFVFLGGRVVVGVFLTAWVVVVFLIAWVVVVFLMPWVVVVDLPAEAQATATPSKRRMVLERATMFWTCFGNGKGSVGN